MQGLTRISAITLISGSICSTAANGQATRTWVSGVGDDVNPCSRTAPCKTFAGAISKTATGGEINCLDPGSFGALTITKSLSIVCQYTEAGMLATLGSSGITVNAPAGSHIYLRGLDLFGAGTGGNGIRFIAGDSVTIEDSLIRAFGNANGQGISFQPSGTSRLVVNNVTIGQNGNGVTGGGILVSPTGAGIATATIDNVRIQGNLNAGLFVSGNSTVMITNSTISHNSVFGIRTSGGAPTVRVGNTTVTSNGTGIAVGAGAISSYGTNRVNGNTTDGGFSGVIIPEI